MSHPCIFQLIKEKENPPPRMRVTLSLRRQRQGIARPNYTARPSLKKKRKKKKKVFFGNSLQSCDCGEHRPKFLESLPFWMLKLPGSHLNIILYKPPQLYLIFSNKCVPKNFVYTGDTPVCSQLERKEKSPPPTPKVYKVIFIEST